MVQRDKPYTFENSSNPWLMDKKTDDDVLEFDGHKYTAKYLWSLNSEEREKALQNVFNYYRKLGFPYLDLSKDKINKDFLKLCNYDENSIVNPEGFISNSSNLCIDLCKYFCRGYFYKASDGSKSVEDIFFDDELFMNVLKNRMGWNTSKEGGVERPYLFPISDKQILNGIRNSGLGYGVSNFRPVIAKWMYSHAEDLIFDIYDIGIIDPHVFDYSGGWGARMMGALACKYNYDCTDPLTHSCLNDIKNEGPYLGKLGILDINVYDKCSEDEFFRSEKFKEKYDIIGSCPPYFDLEVYSNDENQSIVVNKEYTDWLENYWRGTVRNCHYMLWEKGIFILVMKENHGRLELLKDMDRIVREEGFELVEDRQYKSNTNHLSSKSRTGRTSKNNEHILFYKKV